MTDRAVELTERLNSAARDRSFPNLRPRDAATLILVDRSQGDPKVLMGRRHDGHKFMPGKFVFPGGGVEPADRNVAIASPLDPRIESRLMKLVKRPSASKARGYALAAIRETFEETGIMLGVRGATAEAAGPWAAFAAAGIHPDLGAIHFIGRAITPPRRPRRFDARFFAVDAQSIAGRIEGVIGPDAELVELAWVPIAQAQSFDMPAITLTMLAELEERVRQGLSHDIPAPLYRWRVNRFLRDLL